MVSSPGSRGAMGGEGFLHARCSRTRSKVGETGKDGPWRLTLGLQQEPESPGNSAGVGGGAPEIRLL